MSLLKLNNISISFESKNSTVKALDNLSFDINEGEFISIIGPSGCGKTTLLRLIGGLLIPAKGKIDYFYPDLNKKDIENQAIKNNNEILKNLRVSFVFQDATLLPWRNTIDNIVLPLEIRHNTNKEKFYGKTRKLLKLVNLEKFEKMYPDELSGGMKQRAAISRALISEPSLLLMDEPFGALDELTRTDLNIELNEIWRKTKKTVVLVTHSIPEAVFLSQKIIILSKRPGTVKNIIDINLPEKRDMSTLDDTKYFEYISQIRKLISN